MWLNKPHGERPLVPPGTLGDGPHEAREGVAEGPIAFGVPALVRSGGNGVVRSPNGVPGPFAGISLAASGRTAYDCGDRAAVLTEGEVFVTAVEAVVTEARVFWNVETGTLSTVQPAEGEPLEHLPGLAFLTAALPGQAALLRLEAEVSAQPLRSSRRDRRRQNGPPRRRLIRATARRAHGAGLQ